jgi:flagellar biosynthesis protein FlhG
MTDGESTHGEEGSAAQRKAPTIWAIASGKGGVGKSLVASSLAISFASRGHRCAMIDLDLGAANQHTLLGVANPRHTLSDFLDRKVTDLSETLCRTRFANLDLVSGARASLTMANPKHSQKEKILRHIRNLDFEHIFLDLSAGCSYNVLDFFLAADHGVVVVIPERTSIENTQNFLRTAFFRSLGKVAKGEPVRDAIVNVLRAGGAHSARALIRGVTAIDSDAGGKLASRAAAFAPMLVINQLESTVQRENYNEIALACRHYLTAGVKERGSLPRDQCVRDAANRGEHVLSQFPGSRFSTALHSLAENLISGMPSVPMTTLSFVEEGLERRASPGCGLPPLDVSAPGAYLRCCREQLGWSLGDVRKRTRIRNIAGIEEENYQDLPPEIYVAGFVRQYARALGVQNFELLTKHYLERYRAAQVLQ